MEKRFESLSDIAKWLGCKDSEFAIREAIYARTEDSVHFSKPRTVRSGTSTQVSNPRLVALFM